MAILGEKQILVISNQKKYFTFQVQKMLLLFLQETQNWANAKHDLQPQLEIKAPLMCIGFC